MESTIKEVTGKLFKDGPYEYMIYIKSGDLGVGVINSISIVIENAPDYIGIDILLYVMGHLIDAGGEELKNSQDEFMINKIVMEQYESLGEMITAMGLSTEFGLQSFTNLNNTILTHKDKKIDLKNINQKISTRTAKLTKAMDYMINTFTSPIEGISMKLSYEISGKPIRFKNEITPALNIDVMIGTNKGVTDYNQKNVIIDAFKDQLLEVSPIQIHSYDKVNVNITLKPDVVNGLTQIKA
jgi:hypothetical protein